MKIGVTGDTTTRTITFEIKEGAAPDLDITETWHLRPRLIRPQEGWLKIIDGQAHSLTVKGQLIRKDGQLAVSRDRRTWYAEYWRDTHIASAPEWARKIWAEAPAGMTGWTYDD